MKPPKKPIKQDSWYPDYHIPYEEYDGGWSRPPYEDILFDYDNIVISERALKKAKINDPETIKAYQEWAVDHYSGLIIKRTTQEAVIAYLEDLIERYKYDFMYDIRDLREEIYGYHGSVPD